MSKFLGFGNGGAGVIPTSGVVNTYSPMTATSGQKVVTTNLTVALYDMVLLWQTQATGAGAYEIVIVANVGSGQFTALGNLDNSYVTGAQAVKIPQYASGSITGGIVPSVWDKATQTGGIVFLACNGRASISGSIRADGFENTGAGFQKGESGGQQGGSYTNESQTVSTSQNAGGGGGGTNDSNGQGGGGGGFGASGGGANDGQGGATYGNADMSTLFLGSGGGAGGRKSGHSGAEGGYGAGAVIVFAKEIIVPGTITANGYKGGDTSNGEGAGGGGSGGTIFLKGQTIDLTGATVTANGGAAGVGGGGGSISGGAGGVGRIRFEACKIINNTGTPTPSNQEGGFSFCGSVAEIL